jgi:hypothetical protein
MKQLWPRLTSSLAASAYESMKEETPRARTSHPAQIYNAVGGRRVTELEIERLSKELEALASSFGYPERSSDSQRVAFDRHAAEVLHRHMSITWSEASARDVWSFLAIVALPDLTSWRFGPHNVERWVATDLTRHTWARLWWHYVTFEGEPELLNSLSESDLNQLLERRSIGGDIRLVRVLARGVVDLAEAIDHRRDVIRDVTARMRRRMAFTDTRSLSDTELRTLVSQLLEPVTEIIAKRSRPRDSISE